jgi:hypothetical protein
VGLRQLVLAPTRQGVRCEGGGDVRVRDVERIGGERIGDEGVGGEGGGWARPGEGWCDGCGHARVRKVSAQCKAA